MITNVALLYEREKHYFMLAEEEMELETLIYHAVKDFSGSLLFPEALVPKGEFTYDAGRVLYEVEQMSKDRITVNFQAFHHEGGKLEATIVFDRKTSRAIQWKEL